jgi:nitrous oxide reductase accessory protein NosL
MKAPLSSTLVFALLLGACAPSQPDGPIEPPCAQCSMIIGDPRFAGAIGTRKRGKVEYFFFDDVGEMFLFEPPAADATQYFVADHTSTEWVLGESAFYLRSSKLRTPMATGVAAFALEADREALAERHRGERPSFSELRARR